MCIYVYLYVCIYTHTNAHTYAGSKQHCRKHYLLCVFIYSWLLFTSFLFWSSLSNRPQLELAAATQAASSTAGNTKIITEAERKMQAQVGGHKSRQKNRNCSFYVQWWGTLPDLPDTNCCVNQQLEIVLFVIANLQCRGTLPDVPRLSRRLRGTRRHSVKNRALNTHWVQWLRWVFATLVRKKVRQCWREREQKIKQKMLWFERTCNLN